MRGPKKLAWDDKTELITGVKRISGTNGFYNVRLGPGRFKYTDNLYQALAWRRDYDRQRHDEAQRETPEARRARNLAKRGGGSQQERAFAMRLRVAFEGIGWECHILNDFTLADVLVRPKAAEGTVPVDQWHCVQLKTTADRASGENKWSFSQVSHYGRMLVACHALAGPTLKPRTWLYDGTMLETYVPSGTLNVAPGGVWDTDVEGRLLDKCEADDAEACARETARLIVRHVRNYPTTTMEAAQWTFEDARHFDEFASLSFLMRLAEEEGVCKRTLPEAQQAHHDLDETHLDTGTKRRLQAKGAQLRCRRVDGRPSTIPTASGLHVVLHKRIGDKKAGPYNPDDFDVLVVVWRDVACDLWHVWRIPMDQLPRDPKTDNLLTAIKVHLPQSVYRDEDAHGPPPKLVNGKRGGRVCDSYEWSIPFHTCYPMKKEWEPPVPWPDELAHKERRVCVVGP